MKDTQAPQECDLMTGDSFIQAVAGAGVTASSFFCNYNRKYIEKLITKAKKDLL